MTQTSCVYVMTAVFLLVRSKITKELGRTHLNKQTKPAGINFPLL